MIPPTDLFDLGTACQKNSVPFELHMFNHGTHGLSLADESVKNPSEIANTHVREWFPLMLKWLAEK